MSIAELIPVIQSLSRAEKLRLIQVLAAEIAQDEGVILPYTDLPQVVWSPYDAFDGALTAGPC